MFNLKHRFEYRAALVYKETQSRNVHSVRRTRDSIYEFLQLTLGESTMKAIILLGLLGLCAAAPQFLAHPATPYAHPAVLINSAMEDALPNELKNSFYENPRIAAGLAKESWFTNKEMQVIDREAEKIPREKIYNVLHNAGLARR